MTVTITIPQPVLITGQYFIVKYRLIGDPTWIDASPQDNDPFDLTIATEGDYEMSAALVNGAGSPVTVCEEVITNFTVVDIPPCLDYEVSMIKDRDVYQLEITYVIPSPVPDICFIEIAYGPNSGTGGTTNVIQFTPFASPYYGVIYLPASNEPYDVTITQIGCNGIVFPCESFEVLPPDEGCDDAVLESSELEFRIDGTWWIVLTFTQSNPYTDPFYIGWYQSNAVNSGQADPGGGANFPATQSTTVIEFQVYPNLDVVYTNGQQQIDYKGVLVDRCYTQHKWEASFILS